MKNSVLNYPVLVLNSSWSPINVTVVKEAIGLIFKESAYVVVHKDLIDKYSGDTIIASMYEAADYEKWIAISENMTDEQEEFINSGRFKHFRPHVIKLVNYNKVPNYHIRLSRRAVYDRDSGKCQYCGKNIEYRDFTVDHILPKSKGGQTIWSNIVTSCRKCNFYKDDKTIEQAGLALLKKPEKPGIGNFSSIYRKENEYWSNFIKKAKQ